MSIYPNNLSSTIRATIKAGGVDFIKDGHKVAMTCRYGKKGYEMDFSLDSKRVTVIYARSAKDVQNKLVPVVVDLFRTCTLKGMI